MGMRVVKLAAGVDAAVLRQGNVIARSFVDNMEQGKLPAGDATDFILGLVHGNVFVKRRILEGEISDAYEVPLPGVTNFEAPIGDNIVCIVDYDDPVNATTYVYEAGAIVPGDEKFKIVDYDTLLFPADAALIGKKVQARYTPSLTQAEAAQSFDVGLGKNLNSRYADVQSGYAKIHEPGDILITANFDYNATFANGFAYALSSGLMGDQSGAEVIVGEVLEAPSPSKPVLKVKIVEPKTH